MLVARITQVKVRSKQRETNLLHAVVYSVNNLEVLLCSFGHWFSDACVCTDAFSKEKNKDGKENKGEGEADNQLTIVLKMYLHCQECAKPIVKCLKGFQGIIEVDIDFKDHKVIIKGHKDVDPSSLVERLKKKYNKIVEIVSPTSKHHETVPQPQENTIQPKIMRVILSVYIHCENCGKSTIKKIKKMTGVETVEIKVKDLQVIVTGEFEPKELLEHVVKRMRKQASITKVEIVSGGPPKKAISGGSSKEAVSEEPTQRQKSNKKANNKTTAHQVYEETFKSISPKPKELDFFCACDMLSDENAQACIIM